MFMILIFIYIYLPFFFGGGGVDGGEGKHSAVADELSFCDEVRLNRMADASSGWAVARDKRAYVWVREQG